MMPLSSPLSNIRFSECWVDPGLFAGWGGWSWWHPACCAACSFCLPCFSCCHLRRGANSISPLAYSPHPTPNLDEALSFWSGDTDILPRAHAMIMKSWDTHQVACTVESLLCDDPDDVARARLLAVMAKESGAWLHALPISTLGLRMDGNTIRVAVGVGLRLDSTSTAASSQVHSCQPSRFHRESPEIFSISRLPPGLHICNSISRDYYLSLHTCIDKTPSFCKALVSACSKVQLEPRHYNTSCERVHIINIDRKLHRK